MHEEDGKLSFQIQKRKQPFQLIAEFSIEGRRFQLNSPFFSGIAGAFLSHHRGYPLTTKEQDNDSWSRGNCAVVYKGTW